MVVTLLGGSASPGIAAVLMVSQAAVLAVAAAYAVTQALRLSGRRTVTPCSSVRSRDSARMR